MAELQLYMEEKVMIRCAGHVLCCSWIGRTCDDAWMYGGCMVK